MQVPTIEDESFMIERVPNNFENLSKTVNKPPSKTGLWFVALTGGAAVGLSVVSFPFVLPALRRVCLPYVPATAAQVRNVLSGLSGRSGRLVDLGSGDGRIVLAAAEAGFRADGVELNPWLVLYSRLQAWRLGLGPRAAFLRRDLWRLPLGAYRNVVVFGVEEMMPRLQSKLQAELCDDALVIACRFPFPCSWKPTSVIGQGIDTVWVYAKRRP
ncbi:ATP synthase subunit C lysine N-methyltransferase isoform X2 [Bacillus rossius redtenbacheri]|uniref:ATP synthase subunit C lysine N-methyltransferase isoform X2 n=1 Tax=Bacillus rossius redtenbacheri TaxID=93214 RepID=UPI002FDE2681